MKKNNHFIALYFLILLASGCAQRHQNTSTDVKSYFYEPSKQEQSVADYGEYPDNYENIVKGYMQTTLKDPESARYRFIKPPVKYYTTAKSRNDIQYCWAVFVGINSKNSYGGYAGESLFRIYIKNGIVIGSYP